MGSEYVMIIIKKEKEKNPTAVKSIYKDLKFKQKLGYILVSDDFMIYYMQFYLGNRFSRLEVEIFLKKENEQYLFVIFFWE